MYGGLDRVVDGLAARLLPHALRADVLQLRQVVVVLLGPLLAARSQRGLAA